MSDFDQKCVYLELRHGKAVKMECLRPWSKPEYKDAVTPFSLSATYKITYEDGAEVVIGGLPAYALAQGSFWYFSDSKKETESVFARDDRVLAYLAQSGQILRRERRGECILPSQDEADCILNGLDVPFEAIEYGCEWACKNMDRWVNEWKQRGLIKWDDDNHIWRIVRKSIKEKWKCWAVKRTLKAGQESLPLDGKDFVIADANLGRVKRITVESGVEILLLPRNPMTMEAALIVEYENGIAHPDFFPWETLALGWVRCYTNGGNVAGFLCNKQVVAAVGRAIANLEPFLDGDIAIPGAKEADEIIKRLDIPYPPISYREAGMIRPCIKLELMKKWKKSGKLCQMKDGSYEIEKLPRSKNVEEVRMALEKRKEDCGREERIAKRGAAVAQEAMDEEKRESKHAKHAPKSAGLSKKKGKRSKGKPKMVKWPKNKAEHRENQMRLWGGEEGLKGFETRELKTSSGKKCTYRVRVDPSGRMWIADTGEDAPAGYYSQSSKYYVLTRNARPSKRGSTMMQRGMWYACQERFKSPGGFLVSLGNRGLIRKIDGKNAEMNLGKSTSGRKLIDSCEAYYPGAVKEKKSRYILVIEQAKIKPDTWAACDCWFGE